MKEMRLNVHWKEMGEFVIFYKAQAINNAIWILFKVALMEEL
jgi:hypothetical protein